jgi:thioredoxin-related protein
MNWKVLSLILMLSFSHIFAQEVKQETEAPKEEKSLVKWMTLQEALELQKTQPKKIFMDVYTDWCGWCKHMMKTTFSNPSIAGYINTNYYPVHFNGETKDTIEYKGKKYYNTGTGKNSAHQLTLLFTNKRPSYPTIIYFDEQGNVISPVPGYMDTHKIESYLVFFTENVFRTTEFGRYKTDFDRTFIDSLKTKPEASIKWYTFEEAQKLNKTKPKMFFVDAYNSWSVTQKVMDSTTYSNKEMVKYITDNFYPVKFDMLYANTLEFFGKKYSPQMQQGNPFYHQFGMEIMNKKMISPSVVFIDSDGVLLSHVPGFFTKDNLYPVLIFFAERKYSTQTWKDFATEYEAKKNKPKE